MNPFFLAVFPAATVLGVLRYALGEPATWSYIAAQYMLLAIQLWALWRLLRPIFKERP
jgi:hypothetical protein